MPQKIACEVVGVRLATFIAWEQKINIPNDIVQDTIRTRMSFCTEFKPWNFWRIKYGEAIKQVAAEITNRK